MAPIIRICNLILIALAAAAPVAARQTERSALSNYVQARVAQAEGQSLFALRAYAAALHAEPGNDVVARRAFRQAVESGDRMLAIRAAEQLEQAKALPSDAGLFLAAARLQSGNLSGARAILSRMRAEDQMSFLLPVLESWISLAEGNKAAPDLIDAALITSLGPAMATEQRALTTLYANRTTEAVALARSSSMVDARAGILRLTLAASLQARGDIQGALALVDGPDPSFVQARAHINAGKALAGAVDSPASGLAFFYARLAIDMVREKSDFFAMTMARYARFLDAKSPFVAMAEGQALAANGMDEDALLAISAIDADSPYAPTAFDSRVALYERLGRQAEAVQLAEDAAKTSPRAADHVRLGDILTRLNRHRDAAQAYERALSAPEDGGAPAPWALWMLKGGALAQSGDWPAAEAALRTAISLGENEATALNFLGYSLLERRMKVAEATTLISRANTLNPDNAAITDSLGWAYFLSGDFGRAVETLEDAVLGAPIEPTINEHLGDAYWRNGQKTAARYAWRAALLTAEGAATSRLSEKLASGLTDATTAP